ncbi:hypothetical protein B296_00011988 [Ensete ventricosum]|uniref:Uncharacterized protein n=1 Tax=Ensete ventricosum TaxID=4639 RepID=A0A426ZF35_ENSVE|nr:hypothetical protein B296_00011988 [Ensete ventricosum]
MSCFGPSGREIEREASGARKGGSGEEFDGGQGEFQPGAAAADLLCHDSSFFFLLLRHAWKLHVLLISLDLTTCHILPYCVIGQILADKTKNLAGSKRSSDQAMELGDTKDDLPLLPEQGKDSRAALVKVDKLPSLSEVSLFHVLVMYINALFLASEGREWKGHIWVQDIRS